MADFIDFIIVFGSKRFNKSGADPADCIELLIIQDILPHNPTFNQFEYRNEYLYTDEINETIQTYEESKVIYDVFDRNADRKRNFITKHTAEK